MVYSKSLIVNKFIKRMITNFILAAMLTVFYTCTSYVPVIKKDQVPNESSSYIFGIFEVLGEFNANNIGVTVINVNTLEEYNFRLHEGHGGVYSSEVPPGEYQFIPKVIYDFEMSLTQKSPIQFVSNHPELEKKFKVEAGQSVYLGNFFGTQARYGNYMVLKLESYKSDYETDTIRFILNHPNFNGREFVPAYKTEGKK